MANMINATNFYDYKIIKTFIKYQTRSDLMILLQFNQRDS